MSGRG
jgi:signal transduction histidine kinase